MDNSMHFGLPEQLESEEVAYGDRIYFKDGSIVGIGHSHDNVHFLGAIVESAGRVSHLPPAGTKGVLFHIRRPSTDGYTNDVLGVRWENGEVNMSVKLKYLAETDLERITG